MWVLTTSRMKASFGRLLIHALTGLLEGGWVRFYVTEESHCDPPWVLETEQALSVMKQTAAWIAPMDREEGPYVHVQITSEGETRYLGWPR